MATTIWCGGLVFKPWSREEITGLDNGQNSVLCHRVLMFFVMCVHVMT